MAHGAPGEVVSPSPSSGADARPTRRWWDIEAPALRWVALANLAGAVFVFVFLNQLSQPFDDAPGALSDSLLLAVFGAYMVGAIAVGFGAAHRVIGRALSWVDEQRQPDAGEVQAALSLPLHLALQSLALWVLGALLFGGITALGGSAPREVLRIAVGTVIGGVSTCSLTYLLVDRALRPLFALALAGTPLARPTTLGIRVRLVFSWATGSGIPLVVIALSPLGRPDPTATHVTALVSLAAIGLVSGGLMIAVAARSVADRLKLLRRALRRVQLGDTAVSVEVDEGGEVGQLQAGFNSMVAGLRERQQLRDLFGRHVGDEVARQALERGVGLGGEQRQVSVLFVDLIGSTALAATRPASEVVATLNALFGAVVRAAGEEGGWVNKFEGDGALCVFGAPEDQPDHAARSLRAARALRAEVADLRGAHPDLDVGIGVSSGVAVAGNVGAEERYEYTVVGDPVNEAARLTEAAKIRPGRLVVSRAAVAASGEEARWWEPGAVVELRGRAAPTETYEPLDATTAPVVPTEQR
ncbi:MAG TPA: adenylate/guanylate cyclase domain-containing protein [Acidimicrobiales bacterium]|nr:adenylate/guanylate cyclase domain-containing protein [Acidimicrobiales bacterium]